VHYNGFCTRTLPLIDPSHNLRVFAAFSVMLPYILLSHATLDLYEKIFHLHLKNGELWTHSTTCNTSLTRCHLKRPPLAEKKPATKRPILYATHSGLVREAVPHGQSSAGALSFCTCKFTCTILSSISKVTSQMARFSPVITQ